jgi:hypothetical protein
MTLNEIAYNIADASGRGINAAYLERLKFQIKYYRALLLRRDQERNSYLPDQMIQTIEAPISIVNIADSIEFSAAFNEQPLHKSNSSIPNPVRFKTGIPFTQVAYFKNVYDGSLSTDADELLASITINTADGVNATYTSVATTSSGSGTGAVVTVVVTSNAVSSITVTGIGSNYKIGDTITVPALLGTGGTKDVIITLATGDIDPTKKIVEKVDLIPITPGNSKYAYHTKYNSAAPKYFFQNDKIYTLNIPIADSVLGTDYVLPNLFVRAVFEDVNDLRGFTYLGEPCYNDDMEYPCTMDMVQMITQSILGAEQQIEQIDNDNEQVQINE